MTLIIDIINEEILFAVILVLKAGVTWSLHVIPISFSNYF